MTFLNKTASIQLSQDMVEEVATRTEGWLVGLQLLGLSLQGHAAPGDLLEEVSGSQRYIFDYLIEEVFQRQMALRATVPAPTSETAEAGALPPPEQHERDNLFGEIAAYRAIITGYYLGEGHATLAFCQEALAHLSEQNLLARAEVAYAQSLAYHSFGDIVAAIQSTKEATALAQAADDLRSG